MSSLKSSYLVALFVLLSAIGFAGCGGGGSLISSKPTPHVDLSIKGVYNCEFYYNTAKVSDVGFANYRVTLKSDVDLEDVKLSVSFPGGLVFNDSTEGWGSSCELYDEFSPDFCDENDPYTIEWETDMTAGKENTYYVSNTVWTSLSPLTTTVLLTAPGIEPVTATLETIVSKNSPVCRNLVP